MSKAKPSTVSNVTELKPTSTEITKQKYKPSDLIPFTPTAKQQTFIKAFDKGIQCIFQSGSTGTGKTFTALHTALNAVFEQSVYQRVVIIRSAVETRSIGFLPGSDGEKMAAYERPYKDIVEEIIDSPEKGHYENLKCRGYLEFMGTSFVRGITLPNSIIIIDEIQNQDLEEMWSCITRLGKNSRVILCGDIKQNDLQRKREKSGFSELVEIFNVLDEMFGKDENGVSVLPSHRVIEYVQDDIVRDEFVKKLIIAREEYERRMLEMERLATKDQ